jgi:hypothetical protein
MPKILQPAEQHLNNIRANMPTYDTTPRRHPPDGQPISYSQTSRYQLCMNTCNPNTNCGQYCNRYKQ